MNPRNWAVVAAVVLALVLVATALGQGGQLAGLVQPQVVSIEQLVPVDVTVAVPLDDGSVVTATAPITVGISLQVKIDGAGVVSVAAGEAEPETVTAEQGAEPAAVDTEAGADFVDGSGVPYSVETDLPVTVTSVTSDALLESMGSIVGELRNDGAEELGALTLSVRLYDADGKVLGLGNGYTTKDTIKPGGASAFSVVAMVNLDEVASYAIEVSD